MTSVCPPVRALVIFGLCYVQVRELWALLVKHRILLNGILFGRAGNHTFVSIIIHCHYFLADPDVINWPLYGYLATSY